MSLTSSRVRLAALAAAAGLLLAGLAASPVSAEELPAQPETSTTLPADETEPTPDETEPTPDEGSTPTPPLGPDGTPLDPPVVEVPTEPSPETEPWPPISDLPAPVIEVENTVYPEGDWLDGIHVTGSGFVPGIELTQLGVRAGEGSLLGQLIEVAPDGTIDVTVMPVDFVRADTADRPKFMVSVSQVLEDGSFLFSNEVQLTITSTAVTTPPTGPATPVEQPVVETPAAPAAESTTDGPQLAETGFDAVGSALVALVLVAAGGLALARRRVGVTR